MITGQMKMVWHDVETFPESKMESAGINKFFYLKQMQQTSDVWHQFPYIKERVYGFFAELPLCI